MVSNFQPVQLAQTLPSTVSSSAPFSGIPGSWPSPLFASAPKDAVVFLQNPDGSAKAPPGQRDKFGGEPKLKGDGAASSDPKIGPESFKASISDKRSEKPAKLTYQKLDDHVDPVLGRVAVYQFSNGMKFYGLQRKEIPLISFGELYNTGAVNEENWNNGVSHFLEHLIFKGTRAVGPGEFDRRLESLGAGVNASTGYDSTFYHLYNMPKEGLRKALALRAEVVQNALIPQEELDKERQAVIEEINRFKNDKWNKLTGKLWKMLWAGSPYQRTVLGPKANVLNLSREEILDYYARHYGPDKRTIIAVGDFDMPEMLDLIATHYNQPFPPQGEDYPVSLGRLKHTRDGEPVKAKPARSEVSVEDPDVNVMLSAQGFDGPRPDQPGGQREVLALEMLSLILGGDESSRLYQDLVEKKQLASDVGMGVLALKARSGIYTSFQARPEHRKEVERIIREHLDRVIRKGVTPEEMDKVKIMVESSLASGLETSASIMHTLASALGDNSLDVSAGKALEVLKTITPEEIRTVAAKYLTPERAKRVTLLPKIQESQESGSMADSSVETDCALKAETFSPIRPSPRFGGQLHVSDKSVSLPGGTELLVREKPHWPVTSISLRAKGGNRVDGDIPGLTDYLADLMERGTQHQSATELQQNLAKKGIALSISTGADSTSLHIRGLTRLAGDMFKILADMVNYPAFKAEELDFVKNQLREHYQSSQDTSPTAVLAEMLHEALYPADHPYGTTTRRMLEVAEKATPERIRELYGNLFQRPNLTIAVAGGLSPERAHRESETLLERLPGKEAKEVSPFTIPKAGPPPVIKADRVITRAREGLEQAEIMRAWPAPGVQDADRVSMLMLNAILSSGMSSRLFQRFREKEEALCYSVSSSYNPKQDGGDFQFYVGTDPKNIMKVQDVFQEELEKLFKTPPTDEELNRAKARLQASILATAESTAFISNHLTMHRGLDRMSIEELGKKIQNVTPEQVREVARKYLTKPSITAIIAPKADLETHGLPVNETRERGLVKQPERGLW